MKEIDISKVINLARTKKYEVTVASFDVVENLPLLDVPRSLKGRKRAIQALSLISDGGVQYGYDESYHIENESPKEEEESTPEQ